MGNDDEQRVLYGQNPVGAEGIYTIPYETSLCMSLLNSHIRIISTNDT